MNQLRFSEGLGVYSVSAAPDSVMITKGMGTHYFQIQLQVGIPQVDAVSMLQANLAGMSLSGANVIIAGFTPPAGGQYRVPRYGELTLSQITALAAETLGLGRQLRSIPRPICTVGLILLATVMAFWCAHL